MTRGRRRSKRSRRARRLASSAQNGQFAAQVMAVAIDAVQSGVLLERTGLSAGDAFSELGDLLLDGLSAGQGTFEPASTAVR